MPWFSVKVSLPIQIPIAYSSEIISFPVVYCAVSPIFFLLEVPTLSFQLLLPGTLQNAQMLSPDVASAVLHSWIQPLVWDPSECHESPL